MVRIQKQFAPIIITIEKEADLQYLLSILGSANIYYDEHRYKGHEEASYARELFRKLND